MHTTITFLLTARPAQTNKQRLPPQIPVTVLWLHTAHVAELGDGREPEVVLFTQGLVLRLGKHSARQLQLPRHVRVGDLGDGGEVEDDGEGKHHDRYAKVHPLDRGERVVLDIIEKHVRG